MKPIYLTQRLFSQLKKKKKKWKEDKKSEKCSEYTKLELIIVKGLWLLCDYEVHRGEIENFLTLFKQ